MIWRIRKVEKNEKIEWNGMVEIGGANKWLILIDTGRGVRGLA